MGKNDSLLQMTGLMGAMHIGPSRAGTRNDGKICMAQGGECRFNNKYYTPGIQDAKSWSTPCADDLCPAECPYLVDKSSY